MFGDLVDNPRIKEMILDKMEFLSAEYGLNKYISGWQLQNKKWWNKPNKTFVGDTLEELDALRAKRIEDFQKLRINIDLLEEFKLYPNFSFIKCDINDLEFLYECDYIINTAAETHVGNSIVKSDDFNLWLSAILKLKDLKHREIISRNALDDFYRYSWKNRAQSVI